MQGLTSLAPALALATRVPLPILAATPDWLAAAVVVVSVALAVLAVVMMFVRRGGDQSSPAYIDPVLIVSALGVVALAVAVWLSR